MNPASQSPSVPLDHPLNRAVAMALGSAGENGTYLQIYGKEDYRNWLAQACAVADDANGRLRRLAHRLPGAPLCRPLAAPPGHAALERLRARRPNFASALDQVVDAARLCSAAGSGMRLQPMLLIGEPGCGKTAFAHALASELGLPLRVIGMAHATAGFALGGMDAGWANAQPGLPFRELVWGPVANPIILLDEIDKASTDERYSPLGALYSLLEPGTARRFCDEMVTLPIDTSAITWLATANELRSIPAPLLSRLEVIEVRAPTPDELPAVLRSVWADLLQAEPWWGSLFEAELPASTLAALADAGSPRDAAKRLRRAAARAAALGRTCVLPEDLPGPGERTRRTPIGFVSM